MVEDGRVPTQHLSQGLCSSVILLSLAGRVMLSKYRFRDSCPPRTNRLSQFCGFSSSQQIKVVVTSHRRELAQSLNDPLVNLIVRALGIVGTGSSRRGYDLTVIQKLL